MSFANYLNRASNVPTLGQLELTEEPNDLTDSSRVGDAITYTSSATYPLVPPTTSTLTPLETSFVPLFQVGLSAEDYLNVALPFAPSSLPAGASELANIDYFMYVLGNSTPRFNLRYAVYDASLNRVQAYQTLTYDPSANPYQSPLISSLEVKGFSIEYPETARYGFIEAQNIDGSGSLAVQFAYATNTTQLSYDSQTTGGSRSSKNQFVLDFGDYNADASGLEPQIQANTANIVVLQGDVATLDASVNALESSVSALPATIASKLPLAGGTMSGAINMGTFGITNVASPSASTDVATKAYVDAQTGGGAGGALPLSGGTMAGVINMNGNDISGLPNVPPSGTSATSRTFVLTQLDDYLPLTGASPMTGAITMGGNKISSLGTPTLSTDATTKGYVDSQDALRLPLTGGALTGNLSTTGDITCATLNYTTLNPPVAGSASNIAQVLAVGNNAGGASIVGVNQLLVNAIPANPGTASSNVITSTTPGITQLQIPNVRSGLKNVYFVDRRQPGVGSGTLVLVLPALSYGQLGTEILLMVSGTGNSNYGVAIKGFLNDDVMYGTSPWVAFNAGGNVDGVGTYLYKVSSSTYEINPIATTNGQNLQGLFAGYWGDDNYNGNFAPYNALTSSQFVVKATCILDPQSSPAPNAPDPCWLLEAVASSTLFSGNYLVPRIPTNPPLGT